MRAVTYPERILAPARAGYRSSVQQVLRYAEQVAPGGPGGKLGRTGTIDWQGPTQARVLFSAPFARIQEGGGTIRPHAPRKALHFRNRQGDWRSARSVHIRGRHYLRQAAAAWPRMIIPALQAGGR